jgi:hypothetical protein
MRQQSQAAIRQSARKNAAQQRLIDKAVSWHLIAQ